MKHTSDRSDRIEYMGKLKRYINLAFIISLFLIALYFIWRYMYEQGMFHYIFMDLYKFFSQGEGTEELSPLKEKGVNELFTGLGALFTFMAFFWQYLANRRQDVIHQLQSKSYSEEKTQAFFMQLIRLIRENSDSVQIAPGIANKRAFHYMYYEFRCISEVFCSYLESSNISQSSKLTMCYSIFVNGIYKMDNGCSMIEQNRLTRNTACDLGIPLDFVDKVLEHLLRMQKHIDECDICNHFFVDQYKKYSGEILFFDGHRQSLSYITKTLIETIQYVCSEISLDYKHEYYFRLMGCQMSDHELFIYILHFNYLCTVEAQVIDSEQIKQIKDGFNVMLRYLDKYMISKLKEMGLIDEKNMLL